MAKKIVAFCDYCLVDGEADSAAYRECPITIDGVEYVMDLCQHHYDDWYTPFTEHVKYIAVPRQDQRPAKREDESVATCSVCDKSFKHTSSMKAHVRKFHPSEGKLDRPSYLEPVECPYCPNKYSGRIGLTQHIRQGHPDEWDEWFSKNGNSTNRKKGEDQLSLS